MDLNMCYIYIYIYDWLRMVNRAGERLGTRVSVIGVSSLVNSGAGDKLRSSNIRTSYLRVHGIQIETTGGGRSTSNFTPQEEVLVT